MLTFCLYKKLKNPLLLIGYYVLSVSVGFGQANVPEEDTTEVVPKEFDKKAIPKLKKPINFDGIVEESEWSDIDTLSFVTHLPEYGKPSPFKTEYRITYDKTFLYFSAICYDDPELIKAPYFDRDLWEAYSDNVVLMLDTYNDNENNLAFIVTPSGARTDATISNDAEGNNPIDISWNTFWEAKVTHHDFGWMVEGRIPFSSLRFRPKNNKVTMGVIAHRYVAREFHLDIYPDIPPNWGFLSWAKPSQATDRTFEGIENKRPWFTSPYALAGTGHHYELNDSNELFKVKDNDLDVGLDVKHAITNNLTMDLSYNTNFAQVEADNQMVNLSRFSLFFPEKRSFFLERASIMNFQFEGQNRLFYSRRIGLKDGNIVPLWGGVRLTGRIGENDVGFLNMQSKATGGLTSENFGVLRFRRKISKNNSYVGGIATSRLGRDGSYNYTYGLDGIIQLFEDDYLKFNYANSAYNVDNGDTPAYNKRNRIYIRWRNRSRVNFNYSFSYSEVGEAYNPGLGFEARKNFRSFGDRVSYGWFIKNSEKLRTLQSDINFSVFLSSITNEVESFLLAPTITLQWKSSSDLTLRASRFYDHVQQPFNLAADRVISADSYINKDISLFYGTPFSGQFYFNANALYGNFYGGKRFSSGIFLRNVFSKHLTLSSSVRYNTITFNAPPRYEALIVRLRMSLALNVKWMMSSFIQHNSLNNINAINLRLRYNPKDGNNMYLVYNETLNNLFNSENNVNTSLPLSQNRSIILKYIHTFHLGQ
ncbi:MAG: DUF5916 domain-containing protein [Bacteroidota bacterium]